MSVVKKVTEGGGAFLTQKGEKIIEVKKEIAELEQLLQGATQTSQSTLLLKKRKEMREVDDALDLMKKDYKKRMDECEERRHQFEQKQAKMRDQVLKFEKFIQENDAKRDRAEEKARRERKMFEDKCKELQQLMDRIEELEKDQRRLLDELAKKNCYRAYLERIVEETDQGYEEIADVLNRHNTLVDANKDLMKHAGEQEKEADELRRILLAYKTEKQNQLLVNNSFFQQLSKQLEFMREQVKVEEGENFHSEDKKKEMSRQSSQVAQAIKNIYTRCSSTMRNKPVFVGQNAADHLEMLDFNLDVINSRIVDLIEITNEYKEEVAAGGSIGGGVSLRELSASTVLTGITGKLGGASQSIVH